MTLSAASFLTRCLGAALAVVLLIGGLAARVQAEDAAVAHPTWTVPAGWQKVAGEKPMRVATFTCPEGEIAVSQFGGNAGGLLANVNRWRGQVGLEPVTAEQLPGVVQQFEIPGFAGATMRLKGESKHMLGAAIYEPKADRTWFIKLTTTPAVADAQEAAFVAFAKSFVPAK